MLTPARRILFENSPLYYPFGNTGAENILKDFNFQLDEIKVYYTCMMTVFFQKLKWASTIRSVVYPI